MAWLSEKGALALGVTFISGIVLLAGAFAFIPSFSTSAQETTPPDYGLAPELQNSAWINASAPVRLANLRGQVVLLEFWTYDCINCIHTIPQMQTWHETYGSQGLSVISNHFPELYYERDWQNVNAAIARLGITYPVALDNDGASWDAFDQHFWPTIYVIDRQGHIRHIRIGEGAYATTESVIQSLLAEPYTPAAEVTPTDTTPAYVIPTIVLNVRAGAGLDQPVIGAVNPNMALTVLSETDGWYQIPYNDGVGYVSAELVTVVNGGES